MLIKLLNSGGYIETSEKFKEYVYSKSKKVSGLVNRRNKESKLFIKDFDFILNKE